MRPIWFAGILGLCSLACQREGDAGASSDDQAEAGKGAETSRRTGGANTTKASDRDGKKKRIPTAEPVPDRPGFVISPYNGATVDMSGVEAGTVVDDPGFPVEEGKQFRVPEMEEALADQIYTPPDIEAARSDARTAKVVPGKPGYIICPWDHREFDASGFEPGAVIMDPSSTPEVPRFLKVPDDHVQPE